MTKDKFNAKLRDFARSLSPRQYERDLVSKIYQSINDLLGENNCIQIGSYPRFTSITPLHDLDILYVIGKWDAQHHDPSTTLSSLHQRIKTSYENPTKLSVTTSLQKHSVTISYSENNKEVFSVDLVPAYVYGQNEFQLDTYKVPEIIKERNHDIRKTMAWDPTAEQGWINSDPRGYIKVATDVGVNPDFRKTVKFIKKWKNNLSEATNKELKLKSFHLEQVVTKIFLQHPQIDIFDAVFSFFVDFPNTVGSANQIPDRANNDKFIDDYLADFSAEQITKMSKARDGFLIKLENMDEDDSVSELMKIDFHKRYGQSEEYLFDQRIPVLKDQVLTINAWVQKDGRDETRLSPLGFIDAGKYIRFEVFMPIQADFYKWRVKNDDRCTQPRGEITDHCTKNNPESTKYKGFHYVECYAIRNNICIASARQNVNLRG